MFLSAVALSLLIVVASAVVRAIVNARDPETHASVGGGALWETAAGLVFFLGDSRRGPHGRARRLLRRRPRDDAPLVMTGARRGAIYASRAAALVLSVYLALAPAVLLALVLALALPSVPDDALGARDVLALVWAIALFAAVYALVSMGIGALLHSNGAAVTISLVVNVALAPVIVLVAAWNETVASFALPVVLGS